MSRPGRGVARARPTPLQRLGGMSYGLLLLLAVVAAIGLAMLYSAANGDWGRWAAPQAVRLTMGLVLVVALAMTDSILLLRFAYVAYGGVLLLLVAVDVFGHTGMGAKRWLLLGPIQVQPSELMKIALAMALGRYFHGASLEDVGKPLFLIPPALMILVPAALTAVQPDLGTAVMLTVTGATIFFLAGVRWWKFALVGALALGAMPVLWSQMHDYQRQRVLTFMNPESDPLGSGYHIIQSKIALGSGGATGKGFTQGSQSHLNYLPEKQTDFIFSMLGEEFGFYGAVGLIGLYALILAYGLAIGLMSRNQFGRLMVLGLTMNLFLYIFINIAAVTGMGPVKGVPLPLISNGGTVVLTTLIGFGLIMSAWVDRNLRVSRHSPYRPID